MKFNKIISTALVMFAMTTASAQSEAGFVDARTQPVPAVESVSLPLDADVLAKEPVGRKMSALQKAELNAVKRWEQTGQADALMGDGGRLKYPVSARPTLTCAPLHICTVELMSGESITSLSLGDTVRWLTQNSTAGDKPVIVIKPTQAGVTTNLVVTTDKGRIYYFHLIASAKEYMPVVSFYDPAEISQKFGNEAQALARQKQNVEAANRAAAVKQDQTVVAQVSTPNFDVANLDFNYKCEGDYAFKPLRVMSDDKVTYMQMSNELKSGDLPAVFNNSNETIELVNARFRHGYFIIDGKPDKFSLVLGVGSGSKVVSCSKSTNSGNWFVNGG
jgi:type IV secretion system protein VirB9